MAMGILLWTKYMGIMIIPWMTIFIVSIAFLLPIGVAFKYMFQYVPFKLYLGGFRPNARATGPMQGRDYIPWEELEKIRENNNGLVARVNGKELYMVRKDRMTVADYKLVREKVEGAWVKWQKKRNAKGNK